MTFTNYSVGFVPLLFLFACSPEITLKQYSVEENLNIIAGCNITFAKLNLARARENVFQINEDNDSEYQIKKGEPTRRENTSELRFLEGKKSECQKYIVKNGTGGIPLIDNWEPETDA